MADTDKKFLDDDGVSQFAEETKKYVDNKVSQLDDVYIRSDDTTIIRLRNQNEINLQEDHNNAWFGYRDGKVTNWKFGDGTEGGLADVYANDYYLGDEKLSETFIRVDDTTIVKLVNDNEINLQEDHTNAWFGYRDGKVTNWKFGDGTEGGLADVYVKDLYLGDQKLSDLLGDNDNASDLTAHTNNADIHVTPSDKANWNAKQDALTNQQLSNIADVANKANDADVVHKSGDTMSGDLLGNGSNNLGTSSNKWKTINGINPGALSLPSTSYVNIDTTEWVLDGSTVNRISILDSYAYLSLMTDCDDDGFIEISMGNYPNGHVYINSKSVHGHCGVFIPFFNINSYMKFFVKANSIRYARWYPCQGNV